jgi:DNA-binding CsgD family transcriptional regulator
MAVALLATGCAILAEVFSSLEPSLVRLCFETLALAGCGLFVAEPVRNRRLIQQAEARLKALVETCPAAIVTIDESGFIELANRSAVDLMAPRDGKLARAPIAAFLPELHHALRWEQARQFSALANDREPFALNTRELRVLRLLVEGLSNKEIAARMEVSESSIKNALQQLFAKTNVRTRAQLVRIAFEHYRDHSAASKVPTPGNRGLRLEARRMLSAGYRLRPAELADLVG